MVGIGLLVLISGCANKQAGEEALDFGWQFAEQIVHDPVDRSKVELSVVEEYLGLNAEGKARSAAEKITNWERGLAYIRLANYYHEKGRDGKARRFLKKAEEVKENVAKGWERARLVAESAVLEEGMDPNSKLVEKDKEVLEFYPDETFRAELATPMNLVKEGKLEEALSFLGHMDYQDIFPRQKLIAETFIKILDLYKEEDGVSSYKLVLQQLKIFIDSLPDSAQFTLNFMLADHLISAHRDSEAKPILKELEGIVLNADKTQNSRVAAIAHLALYWNQCGDLERASDLQEMAFFEMDAMEKRLGLLSSERLALILRLANNYLQFGDEKRAWDTYGKLLDQIEGMESLRLVCVMSSHVCIAIGKQNLALPKEIESRLNDLLEKASDMAKTKRFRA